MLKTQTSKEELESVKSVTALSRSAWDKPARIVITPKLAFSKMAAIKLQKLANMLAIVTVVIKNIDKQLWQLLQL